MLITFVCNQNLARSQALSTVFSKLYPEHEFQSAGLIAIEGNVLPLVVREIFQDWGLPFVDQKARNLIQHFDEISESDVIISINESIFHDIHSLGFEGILVNLEEVAKHLGLKLRDPQLMPRLDCSAELAKYIRVVAFFFRTQLFMNESKTVMALTPETELQRHETLKIAIERYSSDTTIVMADFIVPQINLLSEVSIQVCNFRINSITSQIRIESGTTINSILAPVNASLWPARTYLSSSWKEFCGKNSHPLTLITPPLQLNQREIPENHLAAMFADNVEVITPSSKTDDL